MLAGESYLFPYYVLKMGVFEKGRVFEAIPKEAVEGDVGYPDEGNGSGQ